jgi:hypothetical protein
MTVYSGVCHVCLIRTFFGLIYSQVDGKLHMALSRDVGCSSVGPPLDNMSLSLTTMPRCFPAVGYTPKADR